MVRDREVGDFPSYISTTLPNPWLKLPNLFGKGLFKGNFWVFCWEAVAVSGVVVKRVVKDIGLRILINLIYIDLIFEKIR